MYHYQHNYMKRSLHQIVPQSLISFVDSVWKNCTNLFFGENELLEKELRKQIDLHGIAYHHLHRNQPSLTLFFYKNKYVREAIRTYKFKNRKKYAQVFARLISETCLKELEHAGLSSDCESMLLVPIPSHATTARRRGFCHIALIAHRLDQSTYPGISYTPNVLVKTKKTKQQSRHARKSDRLASQTNAFTVPPKQRACIKGRTVLLLDDVRTTGATLASATRTLRDSGAHRIIWLTLAH